MDASYYKHAIRAKIIGAIHTTFAGAARTAGRGSAWGTPILSTQYSGCSASARHSGFYLRVTASGAWFVSVYPFGG